MAGGFGQDHIEIVTFATDGEEGHDCRGRQTLISCRRGVRAPGAAAGCTTTSAIPTVYLVATNYPSWVGPPRVGARKQPRVYRSHLEALPKDREIQSEG